MRWLFFNYEVFTTAIYKAWYGFFSFESAAQLACLLVMAVFVFLFLENRYRQKTKFQSRDLITSGVSRLKRPTKVVGAIMFSYCFIVFSLGFLLPFLQLLIWAWGALRQQGVDGRELWNSFIISLITALAVVGVSFFLVAARRFDKGFLNQSFLHLCTLGYALPGAVLAVAVFNLVLFLENLFWGGDILGLTSGSLALLVIALSVKFLAVSYQNVSAQSDGISPSLDEGAHVLGAGTYKILRKIHLPLLSKGLLVSFLLVMIETIKEMPITLMMRPFSWNTLSVRVFELTSEGEWQRAAVPSVMIVLLGLVPVLFLFRQIEKLSHKYG